MIPVQLNPDEAATLHKILLAYLSDLRVEIASMDIALNARSSSIAKRLQHKPLNLEAEV